jgi:NAD(P)-dependent dehydrogenase (short-subunit alcohol dehydrogenase family)
MSKVMNNKKVWFVTGASKGLGLTLVKQLLESGHTVAATSRNKASLSLSVGANTAQFLPLEINLANDSDVAQGVRETIATFGRIDVVVNNAGYGIGGSIEELTDQETRASFDINVFGTLNVIRHVLPYLRAQRSGHIINIASIAGIAGATGWSVYAAAKAAVIALTEVLATDVREFGIHATVVAPGAFRTGFLSSDSLVLAQHTIDAYTAIRSTHDRYLQMDGAQAGDPSKAVAVLMQIAEEANPPIHLLLGSDAYQRANQKLDFLRQTFQAQEQRTTSTDFEQATA